MLNNIISNTNFNSIPQELKKLKQWVAWFPIKSPENDKINKIPIVVGKGYGASSTDEKQWKNYLEAVEYVKKPQIAGSKQYPKTKRTLSIGFVLKENSDLYFLDLDHCMENPKRYVADKMINAINSYTEISPSGNGFHIFFRAKNIKLQKKKFIYSGINCEIYNSKRFSTFTGNVYEHHKVINNSQKAFDLLVDKYLTKNSKERKQPIEISLNLKDREVVAVAMNAKNGYKFSQLFHAGNIENYGNDTSSAIGALIYMLIFYCKFDKEQIYRIFIQSRLYLMRSKWQNRGKRQVMKYLIEPAINDYSGEFYLKKEPPMELKKLSKIPKQAIATIKDYELVLNSENIKIQYDELSRSINYNGRIMDSLDFSVIYIKLREKYKWNNRRLLADYISTVAKKNKFNPLKQSFEKVKWDGEDHIKKLCKNFVDEDNLFYTYFIKWMVGAVARVYQQTQNRVLVLEGDQGIGKSWFCKWLVKKIPHENAFHAGSIDPNNEKHRMLTVDTLLWEVSEIAKTTKKNIDSLKDFLSSSNFKNRPAYEKQKVRFQLITSFIGTFNNVYGFLKDPTGDRRFMTVALKSIDFKYCEIDQDQLWAQALYLYKNGFTWHLDQYESKNASESNEKFEIEDLLSDQITKIFEIDKTQDWFTPSVDILDFLKMDSAKVDNSSAFYQRLSIVMKKFGLKKTRVRTKNGRLSGYSGIKKRKEF